MSSRTSKESVLKDNLKQAVAKSKQDYRKEHHTAMPKEREQYEKAEFGKAVKKADSMLSTTWNEPKEGKANHLSDRPMFGYFGGVDFDENGKIKQ